MARTDTLTNFLTDVAAAIKTKKGDNTAIPAANFDTEIVNLPSGGSDNTTLISLIDRTVTSIEIPEGTPSIGSSAFSRCTGLTSVTIPGSVTSIGGQAFEQCFSLTSITIPNGVTRIYDTVFKDCTNLTKINWNTENVSDFTDTSSVFYNAGTAGAGIDVVFGNNVEKIPTDAFYISDTNKSPKITSVIIGNSVKTIGSSAFRGCTGLTSVTIGNSVTRISYWVFKGCTSLTEIDFSTHTTVPTLSSANAFSNTSSNLVIKVPSTLLDEWKAATNWDMYADKIVGV